MSVHVLHTEDTTKNQTIASRLESCIYENFTFDRPQLRYTGIQEVFLYEKLPIPLKLGRQIRIGNLACTLAKFQAVSRKTHAFDDCSVFKADYVFNNLGSDSKYLKQTCRQIHGRIFKAGMSAIEELDSYYLNGIRFNRRKHFVAEYKEGKPLSYKEVWMYVANAASVFKYDPHSGKYNSCVAGTLRIPTVSIKSFGDAKKTGYNFMLDN